MAIALPRVADAASVRIMPVGDSITDGYNIPGGYRIHLEDALAGDGGYQFDFVGSLANGPASLADPEHEGHTGRRIDELAPLIDATVARHRPEVMLLTIGTNDVLRSHALAQAPQRLSELIDRMVHVAPSATILVSSLTPQRDSAREARVRSYNAAIPAIVRDKVAQGKRVQFIDMHSALTAADLADGVHPNTTGYRKMAAVWRAALPAAVPDLPASAATPDESESPMPAEAPLAGLIGAAPVARSDAPAETPSRLVRLGESRLRADHRGRIRVRVSCNAAARTGCGGVIRLKAERGPRRQRQLATRSFRLSPAQIARVTLRLDQREVRHLRRRASTRVSVEATVEYGDGSRQVTRARTRLEVR